jgi:TRAP transporter 4TM/12TM fusion protein
VFVVWSIWSPPFSTIQPVQLRAIHLGFVLLLVWLYYPATDKSAPTTRPNILDIVLMLVTVAITMYTFFMVNQLAFRGGLALPLDYVVGTVLIVLILEACRRVLGWPLVIVALVFIAYALFGNYLPGVFNSRGTSFVRLVYQMYLTSEGIFGIPLGISATYMVLFVFLSSVLGMTGAGKLFTDVAVAATGKTKGGPAKVAVIASALFGMINGSAATNVATTGTFTIPLMKKVGYPPYFAGAVEAAASTGGQFMPPIMGTVAFLMAEFIGVPYVKIAEAAAIPALIYFLAIFLAVDFRARKENLKGIPPEGVPDWKGTVKKYWHMLLPMVLLTVLLLKQFSPMYAAFWAVITTLVLAMIKKSTRPNVSGMVKMSVICARSVLSIAVSMATAGFLIGVLGITGLGLIMSGAIIALSHGILLIGLIMVMLVVIVLGMGLPTSGAYVIGASICVPILTKMGVPLFVAHFFVLYFACISTITPPVALAAYVGAGMAGADPNKTGWTAFRLALPGLIVAFFLAINPALLLIADSWITIVWAVITALLGTYLFAAGSEGYMFGMNMRWWSRIGCLLGGALLIVPGLMTDLGGLGLGIVSIGIPFVVSRSRKAAIAEG